MCRDFIARKLTRTPRILAFLLIGAVACGVSGYPHGSQAQDKRGQAEAEHKKAKPTLVDESEGHATLWKEPDAIENLDLFYGAGGSEGAPDLSGKFTLVRRLRSGTAKKLRVKDDKGREWTVKFGPETRPETAATRILWAMGYHVDQDYFVKRVHIDGLKDDATNVRFKRNDDGFHEIGLWNWDSNLFNGTRELDGLKVLMAVLNNWDLKDDNNSVILSKHAGGDAGERIYYVSDLGATFASTGSLVRKVLFFADPPAGTKNKPESYAHQAFIDGVENGEVKFHYKGKSRDTLKGITLDRARWIGGILGRLSEKQLGDAFRAAGFEEVEVATLVREMQERIGELQNLK